MEAVARNHSFSVNGGKKLYLLITKGDFHEKLNGLPVVLHAQGLPNNAEVIVILHKQWRYLSLMYFMMLCRRDRQPKRNSHRGYYIFFLFQKW